MWGKWGKTLSHNLKKKKTLRKKKVPFFLDFVMCFTWDNPEYKTFKPPRQSGTGAEKRLPLYKQDHMQNETHESRLRSNSVTYTAWNS